MVDEPTGEAISMKITTRFGGFALGAVLTLSACGSDGSSTDEPSTDSSSPAATEPDVAAVAAGAAPAAKPVGTDGSWYSCATAPTFDFTPVSGRRLQVATTVAPLTSIVANIVGDVADVKGIVPEGTNSHTFEPKPSVGADLAEADLVFINGLKLEEPTKELAATNLRKEAALVELGTLTITEDQYEYDFSFPKEGGKPNPHLWTNPPMVACYASIAGQALATMDPANATTYATNADLYIAKLEALHNAFIAASDTVPASNRKLLTYHDAYAYFAKTYGWEVLGAIQVSNFEEPTPREVADLIRQVKDTGVPAIFGSEVFPSPVLEQIGKEAGVKYVDVLRDDDLPGEPGDPEHSFLGLMRFDYVTMVRSLGGNPQVLEALDVKDVVTDKASYPQ
jgi:ABC-type Zn uptake system ZnuABC Zn-binding protein ZnuA